MRRTIPRGTRHESSPGARRLKKLAPRWAEVARGELIVLLEAEWHLVWGDVCGMVWGKRNTTIRVPVTNERERQTYYGAINLRTKTVHLQERPGGDGANTVAYRQWCQTLYPDKSARTQF
jgi:putative transposase